MGRGSLIPVATDDIEEGEADRHQWFALDAEAVGRHDAGHRPDEVWGHSHEIFARPDGFPDPLKIEMLQIAKAAVQDFQAVGRGATAKIIFLDEGDPQAADRKLIKNGGTMDTSSYDDSLKSLVFELRDLSSHNIK